MKSDGIFRKCLDAKFKQLPSLPRPLLVAGGIRERAVFGSRAAIFLSKNSRASRLLTNLLGLCRSRSRLRHHNKSTRASPRVKSRQLRRLPIFLSLTIVEGALAFSVLRFLWLILEQIFGFCSFTQQIHKPRRPSLEFLAWGF